MARALLIGLLVGAVVVFVGSGSSYAAHSSRGCHNCHVPHQAKLPSEGATVPLWSNVQLDDGFATGWTLYSSKTLKATLNQPEGATKLCLGCHDGTYSHVTTPSRTFLPADGLARSHPVSFVYNAALVSLKPTLNDPTSTLSGLGGTIDSDLLDINHEMQCTSCHDVHISAVDPERMLRYAWDPEARTDANMCKVCHNK